MSILLLKNYLEDLLVGKDRPLFEEVHNGIKITESSKGILSLIPIESSAQSPFVLSCGIHGNETAPIEIINDLLKKIYSCELKVNRPILIIFGHIEAMRAHKRFIDYNLNRLFSGEYAFHPKALESRRAEELEKAVNSFFKKHGLGWHLDLHTAIRPSHLQRFAVYPTESNQAPSQEEINLLKAMGIDAILLANEAAKTFSSYSYFKHQAYAYTLELGKVEPFGKNRRVDFQEAEKTLKEIIAGQDISNQDQKRLQVFAVVHEMIKDDPHYELHLSEDYANFTPLKNGEVIETTQQGPRTAKPGQAVVFPNSDVTVGQRTGLLIEKLKEV
ncbi:MAG: succinylglutamate desuccinylase [Bacteriovoracaceae bacterium]|nr:succinylglutamate desuccinylase [Bacteriovoracaceae bacterium]